MSANLDRQVLFGWGSNHHGELGIKNVGTAGSKFGNPGSVYTP